MIFKNYAIECLINYNVILFSALLTQVCQTLCIGKEEDYFGLKYLSPKGEELWLNLRNQIDRQVPAGPSYKFALRVKFWVPPHLILQDATR